MKLRYLLCLLLLLTLVACGNNAAPTPRPTATEVPAVNTPRPAPTQPPAPTEPPPANTVAPAPTEPPPTEKPAEPTATTAPTDTAPAPTKTSASKPVQPRATATSAGPLQAAIYVANCRSEPSADKPGRIVIQISVEATGGNGKYRYTYLNKDYPTKFIDVIGEKGTRVINEVLVTSGSQQLKKEFDINPADLTCP